MTDRHATRWARRPIAACLALAILAPSPALADVLLLVDGGRIRGEWLNRNERNPTWYQFRSEAGVQLRFAAKHVREARVNSSRQREYQRLAPAHADTVADQWKLAEWCREHRLEPERESHLKRILELDADHREARRALGYAQVNGQWVTQESFFRDRGYEFYQGRWLSPQEILLLKRDAEVQRKEKSWYARLKKARDVLAENPNLDALRTIQNATDPTAVYGLVKLWRQEPAAAARRLYATTLTQIKSPAAIAALVNIALHDPDLDVFLTCMKRLKKEAAPEVIEPFVKALESANNAQVNRAAAGLAQFHDPSTIDALISALVTTHSQVVGKGSPDQMTSTFASGPGGAGGSSFSAGDQRKVLRRRFSNEGVLTALVEITGQSFGFNQQAWTAWWAAHRAQQAQTP